MSQALCKVFQTALKINLNKIIAEDRNTVEDERQRLEDAKKQEKELEALNAEKAKKRTRGGKSETGKRENSRED